MMSSAKVSAVIWDVNVHFASCVCYGDY